MLSPKKVNDSSIIHDFNQVPSSIVGLGGLVVGFDGQAPHPALTGRYKIARLAIPATTDSALMLGPLQSSPTLWIVARRTSQDR